ncbi:MAG: sulfur carrier protein ThiS [Gammaproteobacteria bacterium]
MQITLNGTRQDVADRLTAADLIVDLGLAGKRLAIEVNEQIVPRSSFAARILKPGDRVEIVHAIGGG